MKKLLLVLGSLFFLASLSFAAGSGGSGGSSGGGGGPTPSPDYADLR